MQGLKKTALAVLLLSSTAASAGVMGHVCTQDNVTMPCGGQGWDFGLYGLFLKPAYDNDMYLTSYTNRNNYRSYNDLNMDWGWGFVLEGSYHYSTGNDVTVDWYHNSKETKARDRSGEAPNIVTITSTMRPKWDAVNLEFGQRTNFGEFKNIRFHGGAQFARISTHVLGNSIDRLFMKFNGFGARLGTDLNYEWGNGLSVYAKGAGAILVGSQRFSTLTTGIFDVLGGSGSTQSAVVPELEAKFGARYTYTLAQSDITLDIGYMWQNYFHAQNVLTVSNIGGESDFGLQGPYIGIKYIGYV